MGDDRNGFHDQAPRDDRDRSDRRDSRRDRERDRSYDRDRSRNRDRSSERRRRRSRSRSRSRDRKSKRRTRSRSNSRRRSGSPAPAATERARRRSSLFDQPPPGGASAVPGAPATAGAVAMLAGPNARLFLNTPNPGHRVAPFTEAAHMQVTRHARRVYVGGLPPTATDAGLTEIFNNALVAVGGVLEAGNPVMNVYCNWEKKFAFVEFRSVEETSNSLALDGIMYDGFSIRIRRPSDYNPTAAVGQGPANPNPALNLAAIGMANQSTAILSLPPAGDENSRVFIGGLPVFLTEEQVTELLSSFGTVKMLELVKDRENGQSKGYGFAEYEDPSVVEIACMGLNGTKMGDRILTVRKAGETNIKGDTMCNPFNVATKVVCLEHAVQEEELADDQEFEEIFEDMKDECGKYGAIAKLVIPRPPKEGGTRAPGVGRVFIEYGLVTAASAARNALNGRKFGGKPVEATFFAEDKFMAGELDV